MTSSPDGDKITRHPKLAKIVRLACLYVVTVYMP